MKKITRKELIEKYIKYFTERNHTLLSSASLIPENDNSVLFTSAGMQPIAPYLLGKKHPTGSKRLVSLQKCLRTSDIDEVGDNSHLTFFEMLGNWSLGDYFKEEAIKWSYEFLTDEKYLGIPKESLSFTVFGGSEHAPKDLESFSYWKQNGVDESNIYYLGADDNWWEMGTGEGPCGPDTEMFYDTGVDKCNKNCNPSCNCGKFLEIWNDVFMEYKVHDKEYTKLDSKNVDTGMGVERVITVLNGKESVYDTEIFENLKQKLEILSNKKYEENKKEFRIIMDHVRTSTFILSEDVLLKPTNVGAGYVLRRLIRRAIRYINMLDVNDYILNELADVVIEDFKDTYPELDKNKKHIYTELELEYKKFKNTIHSGMKMYKKITKNLNSSVIDGASAFKLFDTFGFPIEMTLELAKEDGLEVDIDGFNEKFKEHKEKSKTTSSGEFKGGLIDSSENSVKYHTVAHILLAVLKEMFGKDTIQKGQNITPERLRFDFNLDHKMTEEEKERLVSRINEIISSNLPVTKEEMSLEKAKEIGAEGVFTDRYNDIVTVYFIGDISKEICGGPHVENTSMIGKVRIKKEESVAAGTRRLKIVLDS